MERNTSGTREGIRVALALLLACALLMLPLWWQGGSQGHDLFHHLLYGHYFARQLWQGELYPRWLMAMNGGFGSPTFFFYPPLPYYVSALFAGPGAHPQQANYPLLGSATLALLLSGVFAYLWRRATTPPGRQPALSGAALSCRHGSLCPLRPGGVLGLRLGSPYPAGAGSRPPRTTSGAVS